MRNNLTYRLLYIFIGFFLLISLTTSAQKEEIRKEVKVVRPYEPVLSDAWKINIYPVTKDTTKYHPVIKYEIDPKPMMIPYHFKPIKPARMEGESIPRLYKNYLKLGIGNYITPLAEISISSLRSLDHACGFYLGSLSSLGKVKLANGKKVDGNYEDMKMMFYGKKMYRSSTIDGTLFLKRDKVLYYGYNPLLDTALSKDNIRQVFLNPGADVHYYSTHTDSTHLNFDFRLRYDYFSDKYSHYQHGVKLNANLFKMFDGKTVGLNMDMNYFNADIYPVGKFNTVANIEPWYFQSSDEWRIKASITGTVDATQENTIFRLYPKIRFQFKIIPEYLMAYLGVDGGMKINDYQTIVGVNPYIKPGLHVHNTDHKMDFYVGLSGSFVPGTEYKLHGSYSLVDNMPFFVNDTNRVGNRFYVQNDDVQVARVSGEFVTQAGKKLSLRLWAEFKDYSMSYLYKPWHMPGVNASLGVRYNLMDKILVTADMIFIGKRYVLSPDPVPDVITLKAYPDLNLGIEYRYRKILSFFLRFNNLAGIKYQNWNQYPTQGFFIMGGFTYSL
ncbi:MAG TPA: hypothetical protein ENK25_00235 [Bacteroidetes bacterium]|nr:hypothetical protein [Bacteroidota bacterium]